MKTESIQREILAVITSFVANHPHPAMQRFKPNIANWGNQWQAVGEHYRNAANHLSSALTTTNEQTYELLKPFEHYKHHLFWEQSYKKEDQLVGDDMLADYGFAEIIGKNGPFVSTRIRCGIGVWGPNIVYPIHHHQAEEIYLVAAGSALFKLGDKPEQKQSVGDVVLVESHLKHGFRTTNEVLVVFYLWQGGDLRETSTFVNDIRC